MMEPGLPPVRTSPAIELAAARLGLALPDVEQFLSDYNDLQLAYRSAIRVLHGRLQILDDEFQFQHKRNPIHTIQTRLKTPRSMMEKLGRRGLAPTIDVIKRELTDIAGVRIICSYVDDIALIADLLLQQDGVELQRCNDYIKKPKPNGYRSLHMVVTVPVHFSGGVQQVPVEIQVRTIAMDFWASLEHELRYKSPTAVSADIIRELKDCADSIAGIDERMQRVYHQLEQLETQDPPQGGV